MWFVVDRNVVMAAHTCTYDKMYSGLLYVLPKLH
jgi:hypothetical protein